MKNLLVVVVRRGRRGALARDRPRPVAGRPGGGRAAARSRSLAIASRGAPPLRCLPARATAAVPVAPSCIEASSSRPDHDAGASAITVAVRLHVDMIPRPKESSAR
eukprot:SAG31_NODE_529_length_14420_cov_20.000140_4_plen_106_part_00